MYIFYFDFTPCHTHDDDAFEACIVRLTAQPGNCIKRETQGIYNFRSNDIIREENCRISHSML